MGPGDPNMGQSRQVCNDGIVMSHHDGPMTWDTGLGGRTQRLQGGQSEQAGVE